MGFQRGQVQVSFLDSQQTELGEPHIARRASRLAWMLVLAGLGLGVYSVALRGEFIFLDDRTIVANPALTTWWDGLCAIWAHPTIMPRFQPLAYTLYWLEFKLFGVHAPAGYHAINVILHTLNAMLLCTLLRRLNAGPALAVAVVFAVHPSNVEAVAWISQQPLLLSGTLCLLSLLAYEHDDQCDSASASFPCTAGHILSLILFALALTAHSYAATLPLVLLVVIGWKRGTVSVRDVARLTPLLALSILWVCITVYADVRRSAAMEIDSEVGFLTRLLAGGRGAWIYLWHIGCPLGLSFGCPRWQPGWVDGIGWGAALAVVAVAWLLRSRLGRGFGAAATLFLIALAPAMCLASDMDGVSFVADHLGYVPSMVVLAGLGAWIAKLLRRPSLAGYDWAPSAVAASAVLVCAILAVRRIDDYRTSENLWLAALRQDPRSALAHNKLGQIYLHENDPAAAMRHLLLALESDPGNAQTHLHLAAVHESAGETEKAIREYIQARSLAPHDPQVHFGLAGALALQGNTSEALSEYQIVLRYRPDHALTHNNLGLLHADRGEWTQAAAAYENAIRINSSFIPAYINLANLLFAQGRIQDAADTLLRVVRMNPRSFEAYMNAGAMVGQLAERAGPQQRDILYSQAEQFFLTAISLRPDSALACQHLGIVLMHRGKVDEAIYYLGRAVDLQPVHAEARTRLEHAQRIRESGSSPK